MTHEKEEEQQQTLLEELCKGDEALLSVLRSYLYHKPLAAISKKELDILIEEAERSGDFRQAIDKAIFEGSQNPEERNQRAESVRDVASRAMRAAELAKGRVSREGLAERAASFGRKIEEYRFMVERTDDILDVASTYYDERLVESQEAARRQTRLEARRETARDERAADKREEGEEAARRRARRKLSRTERREAKKQEKLERAAAKARRKAADESRAEAEQEERRVEERESAAREERKRARRER